MRNWLISLAITIVLIVASWGILILLARRLPPGVTRDLARFIPDCVRCIRRLRKNPAVPRRAKAAIIFAGLWVASPIDLIPEFIPIIGPLDDIVVVALALRYAGRQVPHDVLLAAWPGDAALITRLLGSQIEGHAGASASRRQTDISWPVVVAVSVGGGLGALARWGLSVALPHESGQWPAATLLTNISGCAAIGVLMVVINEIWPGHRLLRPFLGIGVLGGFTTFSTYAVDIGQLALDGAVGLAVTYLAATLAGALVATWAAMTVTRWAVNLRRTR